jgi:endoglucanase
VYAQFRRFRFNNLNLAYHPDFIRWLAAQPFGDDTLLKALERDLGYRLHLRRATLLPARAPAGSPLQVSLELENLGFGSLYNPKTLILVFRREDHRQVEHVLEGTFYGPAPEEGPAVYTYTVPAPIEAGRYDLYLKISDPDAPEDLRYHVRLATRTAYEEGMHALGLALEVMGPGAFLPLVLRNARAP